MKRFIYQELINWKNSPSRKPLILRGARQVGKTHIVRQLGSEFSHFVEVNFERNTQLKDVFENDLDPKRILRDLSLLLDKTITPSETLLFFDEIQEAPRAINALRYFHEELPNLHIIAAGSLFDFALDNIGIPVGRVNFLFMYPLSFLEFLLACDLEIMHDTILSQPVNTALSDSAHRKILDTLGIYMLIGGMPEAVQKWVSTRDAKSCLSIHQTLTEAYQQDFHKYATKFQIKYLDVLFKHIPSTLGRKFKYADIPGGYRKRELSPCLDLLEKANIITRVYHSSGQGIPLGSQYNPENFKIVFLDVALAQALLGLDLSKQWLISPLEIFSNKGALTEDFVGQELLAYSNPNQKQKLFYWQRETRSSNAEIDYLATKNNEILPIEVKRGKGGQLKSLKIFLESHQQSRYGVRFSTHNFSVHENLFSYPLYAIATFLGTSNIN